MRSFQSLTSKRKPFIKEENKKANMKSSEKEENMNNLWVKEKYNLKFYNKAKVAETIRDVINKAS